MRPRGAWIARAAAVLVVTGAVAASAAADLVWRWRSAGAEDLFHVPSRGVGRDGEAIAKSADEGPSGRGARRLPSIPLVAADPRLAPLRKAADSWRAGLESRRVVVDQVVLVPDVPTFLEAIAAWDDQHYFPILFDEPGWTLPFLRAFRPARVLRYAGRGDGRPSADRLDRWVAACGAVSRAWSPSLTADEDLPPSGAPPRGLGPTPPGLVLSSPDSPMLAGAVALAAGRLQPLIRLEPSLWDLDGTGDRRAVRYGDVLTMPQAWRFARHVEARVAGVTREYDELGDDCDFLTIAGDWPYRYDNRTEPGPANGIQAMDDLIGRVLAGEPGAGGLVGSRRRWAFTGRLLGDPAASVARAMGALFLSPEMAMVWDTYEPRSGRSWFAGSLAARLLGRAKVVPGPVYYAVGRGAGLSNWDRVMDPSNRFGFLWLNSTGTPTEFSIDGGPGHPADLPAGCPAAVVMVHSFSAADPADPSTIAGRWLTQGAFVYFGSVNEPYLQAFRMPGLAVELAIRGVPLSAALRVGESEPLGRPWRLAFLGDPLYRLPVSAASPDRLDPSAWRRSDPAYDAWAEEVTPPADDPDAIERLPADRRLRWCRDAAVAELARDRRVGASRRGPDWRAVLKRIPRDALDPRVRPAFDELLVDILGRSGDWDELHARFAAIPPDGRRPKVRAAMEAGAMFRLARATRDPDHKRGRDRIEALRQEIARTAWPSGSEFPSQFARRASSAGR